MSSEQMATFRAAVKARREWLSGQRDNYYPMVRACLVAFGVWRLDWREEQDRIFDAIQYWSER